MAPEHAPLRKAPVVERRPAVAAAIHLSAAAPAASPVRAVAARGSLSRPPARAAAVSVSAPVSIQCARVSKPSDPAEIEAVKIGRKVAQMSAPARPPTVKPDEEGKTQKPVVQRAEAAPGPVPAPAIALTPRGGAPLPTGVRAFMEPRFGADFGNVRIHTGESAAQQSAALSAHAFTVGEHVFFGRNRFQPESAGGRELIAHELTHTIQQGAAVQRSVDTNVSERSPPQVQRLGMDTVLNKFAEWANYIPGFRLLTIVLGMNPINMAPVERSGANILRGLLELVPVVGPLIVKALDKYGLFGKLGGWMEGQIRSLALVGGAIKGALSKFLDSLDWADILSPGDVWDRAKRLFTEPIDKLLDFVKTLIGDILGFIRDAILVPLAKLAENTRGYDLLKAVIGMDPITKEPVKPTPEVLIGGLLKLIGQEEIWQNMQKANAIPRAWAWFQGALAGLVALARTIPDRFIAALKSLEITDLILPPLAFAKLVGVFGTFALDFINWGLNAAWTLLEIIFDVVAPGGFAYIKKTGAALKSILKNPLPFMGNLVKAAKRGFSNFSAKFLTHLQAGLIDWLTGSLPGVYIPQALSLVEIAKFAFSVLGLTWANIRAKLVRAIGEPAMIVLETTFDIVVTLVRDGPAAAWDMIKDQLAKLQDMVIGAITGMIVDAVVGQAIPKLLAMFIPGAGFISAILTIYDTIMVFVERIKTFVQVVRGFVDSIVAIAAGAIDTAAGRVEKILANLLSLAINFLAGFAGLGKIASKVRGLIEKVRAPIDKALDWLVNWIVTTAKKLGKLAVAKVTGRDKETPEQTQKRLDKAGADALSAVNKYAGKPVGALILKPILAYIKIRHGLTAIEPIANGNTWSIRLEINPVKIVSTSAKVGKDLVLTFTYEPQWPLDEFQSKTNAMKRAAEKKKVKDVVEPPELKSVGSGKTKALRKGGQAAFRGDIKSFIAEALTASAASNALALMTKLQADHQQELQVGGTDTPENLALVEGSMNASLGSQLKNAVNEAKVDADTVIGQVVIDTSTAKAKGAGARTSGAARDLQNLLLDPKSHTSGTIPPTTTARILLWFKLD